MDQWTRTGYTSNEGNRTLTLVLRMNSIFLYSISSFMDSDNKYNDMMFQGITPSSLTLIRYFQQGMNQDEDPKSSWAAIIIFGT